jgi:hypothetical protein
MTWSDAARRASAEARRAKAKGGKTPVKRANISDREADALSDAHEGTKPYVPNIDWERAKKELSPQALSALKRAVAKETAKSDARAAAAPARPEKSWANGGYRGTVGDQLHAMTPQQRAKAARRHPWLAGGR